MIEYATRVERGTSGDDRATVVICSDVAIIVMADGAGGTGTGGKAADAICARASEVARRGLRGSDAWAACLRDADREAAAAGIFGESTALVIEVSREGVCGASVGDSEAWLLGGTTTLDLTQHQQRKPLVGSGRARPTPFALAGFAGRLLVATDGLFKYAPPSKLIELARSGGLEDAADNLVNSVRLRSGSLPDDVALVLARIASAELRVDSGAAGRERRADGTYGAPSCVLQPTGLAGD